MPGDNRPNRRIRPVERQPMREWLLEHLDSEKLPGLTWVDMQSGIFKIRWCHGSRHGWTKKDISVFEQWAKHTGRHYYGKERDEKRWKANFRCALNSLKTVKPVSKTLKGQNAFREYRFLDLPDTVTDVKPISHASPTRVKKEASTDDEEMYTQPDPGDDDDEAGRDQIREATSEAIVIEPIKVPNITILPHFNKISPGLFPNFEYGKRHTIKNHYCGFTVTQLSGDQQQSDNMTSYCQLIHQTSVDSNGYNYPETPEDSLPTDTETEQGDIDMYAQCIEITTDQDTEETWEDISSPEIQSYSHHFPLTPPDEITVCEYLRDQEKHSIDKLPTFISDCNFSINS